MPNFLNTFNLTNNQIVDLFEDWKKYHASPPFQNESENNTFYDVSIKLFKQQLSLSYPYGLKNIPYSVYLYQISKNNVINQYNNFSFRKSFFTDTKLLNNLGYTVDNKTIINKILICNTQIDIYKSSICRIEDPWAEEIYLKSNPVFDYMEHELLYDYLLRNCKNNLLA